MLLLLGNGILNVVTEGFEAPATMVCCGFCCTAIAAIDATLATSPSHTTERIIELNGLIQ